MIIRSLTLCGALCGACAASQFPSFSQQYVQRLGGAVDELARVAADFDASAASLGLDRGQALAQMRGTPFVEKRRRDMERTFARHDRLSADLAALRGAGPFSRALRVQHVADPELATRTWADFRPSLPLTFEGAAFAGAGLLGAWAAVRLVLGLLGRLLAMLAAPLRRGSRRVEQVSEQRLERGRSTDESVMDPV